MGGEHPDAGQGSPGPPLSPKAQFYPSSSQLYFGQNLVADIFSFAGTS